MLVNVEKIGDAGLKLSEPVSLDLLGQALGGPGQDTGFRALGPSQLEASLRKVSGGVLLEGRLTAHLGADCKRCLTGVKVDLPVAFTLNLVPAHLARMSQDEEPDEGAEAGEDKGTGEPSGSFDLEDADELVFEGKTIDLDPILREQVLLALPMNAVCRDDCKGLCSKCGQNLNEKQCGCDTRVLDPRLAALKDIKLN